MAKEGSSQETIDKIIGKKGGYHLSRKHKRFVDEYLIDLNATRAYKAAYNCAEKTAQQSGWQLLHRPAVQRAVQKAMEERQKRCHVDQDRVLQELAKIAFANIRDVISWDERGITVRASNELHEADAAAVAEVSVTFNEYGSNVRVKMHDKRAALVDLGNHLGIFEKRAEIKDPIEEAEKICMVVKEMINTMGGTDNAGQDNQA